MLNYIQIQFDKLHADTGKAILISFYSKEIWIPKKLTKNLVVNKKLGGNVAVADFFFDKMQKECEYIRVLNEDFYKVEHHIPAPKEKVNTYDSELFR